MSFTRLKIALIIGLIFMFLWDSTDVSGESDYKIQRSENRKTIEDINFEPDYTSKNRYDNRIKQPLPQLMDKYFSENSGIEEFQALAQSKCIETIDYKVQSVVEFTQSIDYLGISNEIFDKYEIEHGIVGSKKIKGFIPINNFDKILSDYPDVKRIRIYWKPSKKATTSQGFQKTGALGWHNAGISGSGIKVAVIDDGFEHINNLIASGDFKAGFHSKDFTGNGFPSVDDHGTECAAIIYDFVPDAEFYLINVDDVSDVEDAKNYCIANDVNVISMSLGWDNYYYGDGKGELCESVNDAKSHGIFWVNCSGNEGCDCYWSGQYYDPDADDWLNFYGGDDTNDIYLNAGDTVFIRLTWDGSLENSAQDYDLLLYDRAFFEVDRSDDVQDGNDQPVETIYYTATTSGTHYISVNKYNANGTSNFRLFCSIDYCLEYASSQNSLCIPADASGSFTVGAIDEFDWWTYPALIEDYSSQGPTTDGRIKPDIVAPDGTSEQYLGGYFYGTSSSAPHVAGAAALYWSSNISRSCNEVQSYLENMAIDVGTVGKDNIYGSGKLDLSALPIPDDKYEPNNTHHYAYDFTTNEKTWLDTIDGLGIQADEDWYKINVKKGFSKIKVDCTFTHSLGNIDIELKNSNGCIFTPASGSISSTSTTDNELIECEISSCGTFYIRVFNNDNGNEYNLLWETSQIPPTMPTGFKVDKTSNTSIYLIWDDMASAELFELEQALSETGPWSSVYIGDKTEYTVENLLKATTYWFRLKSSNSLGSSSWTTAISGSTQNASNTNAVLCGCSTSADYGSEINIILVLIFVTILFCVRLHRKA